MGDLGQIVNLDYSIRDKDMIKYAVERSNVVVGRRWCSPRHSQRSKPSCLESNVIACRVRTAARHVIHRVLNPRVLS